MNEFSIEWIKVAEYTGVYSTIRNSIKIQVAKIGRKKSR